MPDIAILVRDFDERYLVRKDSVYAPTFCQPQLGRSAFDTAYRMVYRMDGDQPSPRIAGISPALLPLGEHSAAGRQFYFFEGLCGPVGFVVQPYVWLTKTSLVQAHSDEYCPILLALLEASFKRGIQAKPL